MNDPKGRPATDRFQVRPESSVPVPGGSGYLTALRSIINIDRRDNNYNRQKAVYKPVKPRQILPDSCRLQRRRCFCRATPTWDYLRSLDGITAPKAAMADPPIGASAQCCPSDMGAWWHGLSPTVRESPPTGRGKVSPRYQRW